jgi:hypothetical protein
LQKAPSEQTLLDAVHYTFQQLDKVATQEIYDVCGFFDAACKAEVSLYLFNKASSVTDFSHQKTVFKP